MVDSKLGVKNPDLGHLLAPYRTAVWFNHRGRYLEDMGRLWEVLRQLSAQLNWDSISPSRVPALSIYFGSIVNHLFTLREVNEEMVWCVMVGAPDTETREQVQAIIRSSKIDGLLRVDPAPPDPRHPFYSLMLYGLLTYETLVRMEPVSGKGQRRYESVVGLEVVYPRNETEVDLLTVLSGEEALPSPLRVIGRNLRRWIREPRDAEAGDTGRIIEYARELRHIGAIRAAGVAAGTALELLLVNWSGMEGERVRAERTMLGKLIAEAQRHLGLSKEAAEQLQGFSQMRSRIGRKRSK
jgi:hypothetical protein